MYSLKGNIIHTPTKNKFEVYENSYIFIDNGKVAEISSLPKENVAVTDYGTNIIIPCFSDIHTHAPQYNNMGLGYSRELLSWLEKYTFPLESKFFDVEYAEEMYKKFIYDMWYYGSLHSCVFATVFKESTHKLFELFERSEMYAYIGKVNMNRNSVKELTETTEKSIEDTIEFAEKYASSKRVKFIVTPRFVPSVTGELMRALADIAQKYDLPVQSHLNENPSEIAWVKTLHPNIDSFTQVYEYYGLLRKNKTIMAHSIHTTEKELEILKKYGTIIAHCPESNMNLASGIMPLRKNLEFGINIALGSDISAGSTLDMRRQIVTCIQLSKMYHRKYNEYIPLSLCEAFYIATKGGENFFPNTGSFEKGKNFDALVIESNEKDITPIERLEKFIYSVDGKIIKRYIDGKELRKH